MILILPDMVHNVFNLETLWNSSHQSTFLSIYQSHWNSYLVFLIFFSIFRDQLKNLICLIENGIWISVRITRPVLVQRVFFSDIFHDLFQAVFLNKAFLPWQLSEGLWYWQGRAGKITSDLPFIRLFLLWRTIRPFF